MQDLGKKIDCFYRLRPSALQLWAGEPLLAGACFMVSTLLLRVRVMWHTSRIGVGSLAKLFHGIAASVPISFAQVACRVLN